MRNFLVLMEALDYIEQNLTHPFSQTDVAEGCFVSLSTLQKLFRYAMRLSIKEYVSKRRLTEAAKEISLGGQSILDVSLKYQYQSPEVFARAFKRLWGVAPSRFAESWRFTGIFPRVNDYYLGDDNMYYRKHDISELYDQLKKRMGSYILYFDIKGLMGINKISHEAGDAVIRECLKRIDDAAGEDMMLFRIGGDEFALVTSTADREAAIGTARAVIQKNGNTVFAENTEIPVSMWAGGMIFDASNLKYNALFDKLQKMIDDMKTHKEDICIL